MPLGLHAPLSAFEFAHDVVDTAGGDGGKAEGSAETREDEQAPQAKRRKRGSVPRTAQAWFLWWRAHMAKTHNYTGAQCWRLACQWCPEVFASVNEHAHRRWKLVPTVQQPFGGRRCKKVRPPTLQKMTVVAYSLLKARQGTPNVDGLEDPNAMQVDVHVNVNQERQGGGALPESYWQSAH